MKVAAILACLLLVGCGDYTKVERAYRQGNPQAKELLLHGFNVKTNEYVSTLLIDRALAGDQEALQMIYAQMDRVMHVQESHTTVVVPVHTRTR